MDETRKSAGARLFFGVAFVGTLVSIDTSWRFFGERLHITATWERAGMFAVIELALLACGIAMAGGVRRGDGPGPARFLAWALCAAAGYMALDLAGLTEGLARVALGPVLAVVCLHLALGIEIKARRGVRSGTFARIGRELRERALSRLGLADDERSALTRTRQRAAVRAAAIATSRRPGRAALRRAVLKSGAATDADMRTLLLDTRAALGAVDRLTDKVLDNPWTAAVPVPSVPVQRVRRPSSAPTSGGPVPGWDMAKVVQMIREGRPADEIQALADVSAKNLQRVRRVMAGLHEGTDAVRGDITAAFVQRVREAMV
jgi:hypothetical protein